MYDDTGIANGAKNAIKIKVVDARIFGEKLVAFV
jgi:hypothetical protein